MNIIRKVVTTPILNFSSKHNRLADNYRDYKDPDKVMSGVSFKLKYLGSTLVEELTEEGASYGDYISARAVDAVVNLAKASRWPLKKVIMTVSVRGIIVVDASTLDYVSNLDIHRINFCTADKQHGRVFAFIARNKDNETMECHAFLCRKRKMAQAVTLTVATSFNLAKELFEVEQQKLKLFRQPESSKMSSLMENLTSNNENKHELKFEDNFCDMTNQQLTSSLTATKLTSSTTITTATDHKTNVVNDLIIL